jgi:glycosyltransferase involved in cell wall biosynthesis
MVVVKYFYQADKNRFESFKKSGGKIVFDVCDLLTFWNRPEVRTHHIPQLSQKIQQSELFEQLLPYADMLVVPSTYLAKQFESLTSAPIKVIPDPISVAEGQRLSFFYPVHRFDESINLLWFGNSGEPLVSGIFDILVIKNELENFAKEHSCGLTVISDDEIQFNELKNHFKYLKLQYYPWSPQRVKMAMNCSDAMILPHSKNDFALSKSANRCLLALYGGLPVVATRTESLDILADWILFDFKLGLQKILQDKNPGAQTQKQKIAGDRELLLQRFGPQSMAQQWDQVFKELNSDSMRPKTSVNVSLSGKNVTLK